MRRWLWLVGLTCSMLLRADSITFDFESQTPGAYTSLPVTSSGLTMTVTRLGGFSFNLVSNTGTESGKPPDWGNVSLKSGTTGTLWILDFSQPITSFSIQFGEYPGGMGIDHINTTLLAGPGGTGNTLGFAAGAILQPFPAFGFTFIAAAAPGARSVEVTDGFQDRAYIDNIDVTVAAPEPASILLFAVGLSTLVFIRRRSNQ
jgi:hypothetical protein